MYERCASSATEKKENGVHFANNISSNGDINTPATVLPTSQSSVDIPTPNGSAADYSTPVDAAVICSGVANPVVSLKSNSRQSSAPNGTHARPSNTGKKGGNRAKKEKTLAQRKKCMDADNENPVGQEGTTSVCEGEGDEEGKSTTEARDENGGGEGKSNPAGKVPRIEEHITPPTPPISPIPPFCVVATPAALSATAKSVACSLGSPAFLHPTSPLALHSISSSDIEAGVKSESQPTTTNFTKKSSTAIGNVGSQQPANNPTPIDSKLRRQKPKPAPKPTRKQTEQSCLEHPKLELTAAANKAAASKKERGESITEQRKEEVVTELSATQQQPGMEIKEIEQEAGKDQSDSGATPASPSTTLGANNAAEEAIANGEGEAPATPAVENGEAATNGVESQAGQIERESGPAQMDGQPMPVSATMMENGDGGRGNVDEMTAALLHRTMETLYQANPDLDENTEEIRRLDNQLDSLSKYMDRVEQRLREHNDKLMETLRSQREEREKRRRSFHERLEASQREDNDFQRQLAHVLNRVDLSRAVVIDNQQSMEHAAEKEGATPENNHSMINNEGNS